MNLPERAGRPSGLSLAILMAVLFFSVMALFKLYFAWRFSDCSDGLNYECKMDFIPFDALTIVQGVIAVILIGLAVLAWQGRPPMVRFWFQGTVLVMVILVLIELFVRKNADPASNPGEGVIVSGREAYIAILSQQVFIQVIAALCIFWYCNRAPARAFFRQEPLSS